jgi:hypothetical protein
MPLPFLTPVLQSPGIVCIHTFPPFESCIPISYVDSYRNVDSYRSLTSASSSEIGSKLSAMLRMVIAVFFTLFFLLVATHSSSLSILYRRFFSRSNGQHHFTKHFYIPFQLLLIVPISLYLTPLLTTPSLDTTAILTILISNFVMSVSLSLCLSVTVL